MHCAPARHARATHGCRPCVRVTRRRRAGQWRHADAGSAASPAWAGLRRASSIAARLSSSLQRHKRRSMGESMRMRGRPNGKQVREVVLLPLESRALGVQEPSLPSQATIYSSCWAPFLTEFHSFCLVPMAADWTCVPQALLVYGSHTGGSRWSTCRGSRSRHRALRPSHAAQRRGTDRWSTCWGSRSRHTSPPPASSPARSTAAARTLESEPASPQGWQVPLASTIGLGW